jgi:hypothetical protein
MGNMESHKAGFPRFPSSLEILSGLPHFHAIYDEKRYSKARAKANLKRWRNLHNFRVECDFGHNLGC